MGNRVISEIETILFGNFKKRGRPKKLESELHQNTKKKNSMQAYNRGWGDR